MRTPTLLEAVTSLQVPVNDTRWHVRARHLNELMDDADVAAEAGDLARLTDRLLAAHDWALRSWLESIRGAAAARYLIAATQSRLSLASAAQDVQSLATAVELTHRLTSFADDETDGIDRLRARLFAMCGDAAQQSAPIETWQAFRLVTRLLVDQMVEAANTPGDPAQRRDDAESAMRLAASSLLIGRLLHTTGARRGRPSTSWRTSRWRT